MKTTFLLLLFVFSSLSWAKESDYEVKSWRCGAPLVLALRKSDPHNLLNDSRGRLKLKESLEKISDSNIAFLTKKVGTLSVQEQALFDLIKNKFNVPSVHRTSLEAAKYVMTKKEGMVSPSKRDAMGKTPRIEQELFSGWDCIFTALGPPYGTERYGTVILNLKRDVGFAFSTIRSGYHWAKTDLKLPLDTHATDEIRSLFAEQVFTNKDWDAAMALQIIQNVRRGGSYRGQGDPYDKRTIMDSLLGMDSGNDFWERVEKHRLAYMEGKYIDNISTDSLSYVQFREADKAAVAAWSLSAAWYSGGDDAFIQFFDRSE